jgi:transposase
MATLMGRDHFRTGRPANVATGMSLHILAYDLKRAVAVPGTPTLMAAMGG